jgi:DHA1 family inner membrane transport protein
MAQMATSPANPQRKAAERLDDIQTRFPRRMDWRWLNCGLGGLFIGTGEFAAMGLLPDMAASAHARAAAGGLISAYALGVVVGFPCWRC